MWYSYTDEAKFRFTESFDYYLDAEALDKKLFYIVTQYSRDTSEKYQRVLNLTNPIEPKP